MNRVFVLFAFLGIFAVQALRGMSVGLDTDIYTAAFYWAKNGIYLSRWEPTYKSIMKLSLNISDSPQVFFAIYSMLILLGLGVFIVENTRSDRTAFWSVFLFVTLTQYFSTMNLLRQSLAMAVGCNIYTVLKKELSIKSVIAAILLQGLSFLCHKSGLVLILVFIPFLIRVNRPIIMLEFIGSIALYFLYPYAVRLFVLILPVYRRYLGGTLDTAGSSGVYYLIGAGELLLASLYYLRFAPGKKRNIESYRLLFIVMISFALIVLQRRISLAMRLGYYFELFLILLIPDFLGKWSSVNTRIVMKYIIYLLGWAYFIFSMTVSNARGCVPYLFFWQ